MTPQQRAEQILADCSDSNLVLLDVLKAFPTTRSALKEAIRIAQEENANVELEKRRAAEQALSDHLGHVQRFLQEMYAVMIDPLEDALGKVEDTCKTLLEAAIRDREALNRLSSVEGERDRQYEMNAGLIARNAALESERDRLRLRIAELERNIDAMDAGEVLEERDRLREALGRIVAIGGNLPDDRLTNRTGANDAAHRGLMYVQSREIARATLATSKADTPAPSESATTSNAIFDPAEDLHEECRCVCNPYCGCVCHKEAAENKRKARALDNLEAILKQQKTAWPLICIAADGLGICVVNESYEPLVEDVVCPTLLEAVEAIEAMKEPGRKTQMRSILSPPVVLGPKANSGARTTFLSATTIRLRRSTSVPI